MAEGPDTDPTTLGDAELLQRIRDTSDPSCETELRRRHHHGLATVVAGYLRDTDRGARDVDVGPDDAVDIAFDTIATLPSPSSDGEVFLLLCALVRAALLGVPAPQGPPLGLVDLIDPPEQPGDQQGCVLDAFATLDERDQVLLWFIASEGLLPTQLTSRLSIGGADLAATMVHRSRGSLQRSYAECRLAADDPGAACVGTIDDVVSSPHGGPIAASDASHAAHLAGCDFCRGLVTELHALPNQLTGAIASVIARVDAPKVAADPPTPEMEATGANAATAGPMVISTTPVFSDATRPSAGPPEEPATGSGHPEEPADSYLPPEDDEEPSDRRRVATILGISAAFIVVAAIALVWLFSGRSASEPADPGIDAVDVTFAPSTTAPATTSSSSSTSTTSSTSSTSTSTTVAATTPGTDAPAVPRSEPATAAPSWTPPPQSPAPSPQVPVTQPPVTQPPVTQPPATNPPTTGPPATTAAPPTSGPPVTTAGMPTTSGGGGSGNP